MQKHVTATNVQQDLRLLQAVAEVLIAAVAILRVNITVQAAQTDRIPTLLYVVKPAVQAADRAQDLLCVAVQAAQVAQAADRVQVQLCVAVQVHLLVSLQILFHAIVRTVQDLLPEV